MRYIFIGKNSKGISKQGDGHQGLGHLQKVHTFLFYHIFKLAIAFWVVFEFTKYHCTPIVVSFSLAHIYKETLMRWPHSNLRSTKTVGLFLFWKVTILRKRVISFWQINHFNKNCNFYFAQTWFSTINAGFILNKLQVWFKMLFWILKIAVFKANCNFHFGQN